MSTDDVVLVFGGDLHVQREDPGSMFVRLGSVLREADITFANLESVIVPPGTPLAQHGTAPQTQPGAMDLRHASLVIDLRSDPKVLTAYQDAGLAVLGLGNHGCYGCGTEHVLKTIEHLDEARIAHAGSGRNLAEARKPAIVERKGVRVAFLAYCCITRPDAVATATTPGVAAIRFLPGPNAQAGVPFDTMPGLESRVFPDDLAMVAEDVRKAKSAADVVVTTWHWGVGPLSASGVPGEVLGYQRELAHTAIDSGCDLIIGHHAHVLSAVEVYRGRAVFYSLGNFGFDYFADSHVMDQIYGQVDEETRTSFGLARCVVRDGAIQEVSFLPTSIPDEDPRPVLMDTTNGQRVVERMLRLSKEFGTRLEVRRHDLLIVDAGTGSAVAR